MSEPGHTKSQRRLAYTKFVHEIPVAGRCSQCQRHFEVYVPSNTLESLLSGRHRLMVAFEEHLCAESEAAEDK